MPDISLVDIIDKLSEHVEEEDAQALLAVALDQLDMPVQEAYTPAEVIAIGTAIADAQRETLRESEFPEAQELERVFGPFIDGLKADEFHLQGDAAFEDDESEDEA